MSKNETGRLGMPLLQPAQAQKHVTVNEALIRLDGLVNPVLESVTIESPPAVVVDGQCWAVPMGASSGAWAAQAGKIAIGANGGWVFVAPHAGMRAFIRDQGVEAIHDGSEWVLGAMTLGAFGSAMAVRLVEAEIEVGTGANFDTGLSIPSHAMVIGAVARVTEALGGTLATWRLGHIGATDRFGQGLGKKVGSWARGILGTPMTYYAPDTLLMTAENGSFAGGRVRLSVHWMELRLPI